MKDISKVEKRAAWKESINLNQIDGPWKPDEEFKTLIEKEINGEINTQQMREILNKKYRELLT
jgi:tripartite-type tricarboxylate transporter receptor subunit TctC